MSSLLFSLGLMSAIFSQDRAVIHKRVQMIHQTSSANELAPSYVRLRSSAGTCSGVVIAVNVVLTAAHCVDPKTSVTVMSDDGKIRTNATPIAALRDQDLAVLEGKFERFESAKFLYLTNEFLNQTEKMKTCGYPYNSPHYRCFDFTPTGNYLFRELGKGRLYPSMSGGPVFNEEGYVVGVNSASGSEVVVVSPLVGLELLVKGL
jgi:hypothetical protein